jgi:hypothetical protein
LKLCDEKIIPGKKENGQAVKFRVYKLQTESKENCSLHRMFLVVICGRRLKVVDF